MSAATAVMLRLTFATIIVLAIAIALIRAGILEAMESR